MLQLQRAAVLAGGQVSVYRRVTQIFENKTAFAVGVICLGLFPVAVILAVLFIK
jgi:hypothetical protein